MAHIRSAGNPLNRAEAVSSVGVSLEIHQCLHINLEAGAFADTEQADASLVACPAGGKPHGSQPHHPSQWRRCWRDIHNPLQAGTELLPLLPLRCTQWHRQTSARNSPQSGMNAFEQGNEVKLCYWLPQPPLELPQGRASNVRCKSMTQARVCKHEVAAVFSTSFETVGFRLQALSPKPNTCFSCNAPPNNELPQKGPSQPQPLVPSAGTG